MAAEKSSTFKIVKSNGSSTSAPRPIKVRQDRLQISDRRCLLHWDDTVSQVINFSSFGVALQTEHEPPEQINKAQFLLDGYQLGEVDLQIVRSEQVNGTYHSAYEIVSLPLDVDRIKVYMEALATTDQIEEQTDRFSLVPETYRLKIYEIEEYLTQVEHRVAELEKKTEFLSMGQRREFEQAVVDYFSEIMHEIICKGNMMLQGFVSNCSKEVVQVGFEFFRHRLGRLIYQSPFADRSYRKPLGYAGDFEMMSLIYRNEAFALSLFGRCMEKAMQIHPEPQAVRNRSKYLKDKILNHLKDSKKKEIHILSVASGPAFEVQLVLEELSSKDLERVTFHFLDQDILSLKSAQRSTLTKARELGKTINVELIHQPIKSLIVNGVENHREFDFIYSAGLFDYLSDAVATRSGQVLYSSLAEGGTLIIGNFNSATPNAFGMLSLFDWYLILRSEADLLRLFDLGPGTAAVESENNEINLFYTITKS